MLPDIQYKGKILLFWAAAVPEYMKPHHVWQCTGFKKFFDHCLLLYAPFPFDPFLRDDLKKLD